MLRNPKVALDFQDGGVRTAIDSENASVLKNAIGEKINACSIVVCLIGNGTAWRDWVDWEIRTALDWGKGVCGIRLKDSRGRAPEILRGIGAPVARWDLGEMVAAIECEAARRG